MARSLNQLRIPTPCEIGWQNLTPDPSGDASKRFCADCQRHVHSREHLTNAQAQDLLCASAGNLCLHLARDAAGKLVTLDYAPPPPRRRWPPLAAALALVMATFAALGIHRRYKNPAIAAAPAASTITVPYDYTDGSVLLPTDDN